MVVIRDLDDAPGYGSFWGEVNSNIHKGLGCNAVITNGSVRDLPDLADGFQEISLRSSVRLSGKVLQHGVSSEGDSETGTL